MTDEIDQSTHHHGVDYEYKIVCQTCCASGEILDGSHNYPFGYIIIFESGSQKCGHTKHKVINRKLFGAVNY